MTRARTWLFAVCGLVASMVVLGGITRVTGSGLSIVEWAPVSGVLPPTTNEAWSRELASYLASPEGRLRSSISLREFQAIYLVEWAHRMLARLTGFVLLLPWVVPSLRRALPRKKLVLVTTLVVVQAVMGWAMVKSGLVDTPRPSTWRLGAHLLLAFALFGVLFDAALPPVSVASRARMLPAGIVMLGVASGAAMAGTRAGFVYPTFPTMGGAWIPRGLYPEGARSIAEDAITAHFDHRLMALIVLFAAVVAVACAGPALRARARLLLAAVSFQVVLGAGTVILHVPMTLAVLHQLGGLAVFAAAVSLVSSRRSGERDDVAVGIGRVGGSMSPVAREERTQLDGPCSESARVMSGRVVDQEVELGPRSFGAGGCVAQQSLRSGLRHEPEDRAVTER